MRFPALVLVVSASAALSAAAAWRLKPAPAPGPAKVQIDTVYAEAERPDLVRPSIGQKLTTAAVKPLQTRVADAPSSAGRQAVEIYCRPPVALQTSTKTERTSRSDTTSHIPERNPAAVLPDFRGRRRGSQVTLFSTLNSGRRWSADYRTRGDCEWESSGDSVLWRCDRLWKRLARGAVRCAPAVGGSSAIGALADVDRPLRGAILGGAAATLGCLF